MIDTNEMVKDEWHSLMFYYDFDERLSVNQWRFYGSKEGLLNFSDLLLKYAEDSNNEMPMSHEHWGPYCYLKIMTLDDESIIGKNVIGGKIEDLKYLSELIKKEVMTAKPEDFFNIDNKFGKNNEATAKFFVMSDDFDPVTMDELIISNRQEIVNKKHNNRM